MSTPGVNLTGDWAKAFRLLSEAPRRIQTALNQGVLQEAHRLRDEMIRGLDKGAPGGQKFKSHSPLTLIMRRFRGFGGSKILIQSSALRNSIVVVPIRAGVAFVGVRRRGRGKGGKKGADLAHIHEFGRTWTQPFTSRQARFLFAMIRKAGLPPRPRARGSRGAATITIRIPARPFIGPVVKNIKEDELKARLAAHVAAALRV